jgi:signal transduction histidine kinase
MTPPDAPNDDDPHAPAQLTTREMLTVTILDELTQPLAAAVSEINALHQLAAVGSELLDAAGLALAVDRLDQALLRCRLIISRIHALAIADKAAHRPLPIENVVRSALRLVESAPGFDRVRFELDTASVSAPLLGDAVQLEQVVANLLANALAVAQSQPEPLVRIRAQARSTGELGREIEVVVTDNGPGVPPAERDALFQPHHRVRPGGTGLGLAVCRAIVELHGGRIWHEAVPGGGAAFHFTVPAALR